MAIRPIRLFGDPVLSLRADEVVDFDKELRRLVDDLTDTMMDANGAGLAAPQIGVSLRAFTFDVDDVIGHIINPEIVELSEEEQDGLEGCLSFPGEYWPCTRAARAVARGMTMHGEPITVAGSDTMARCLQHETDHLDGILFIDRLDTAVRKEAMAAIRQAEWASGQLPEVRLSPHPMFGTGR